MDHLFIFGVPRSGTTYLTNVIGALKSVEGVTGLLIPVSTCHLVDQDISDEVYDVLAAGVKDNIDDYLSGVYNSRFKALEDWVRAPRQTDRLYDVIRSGTRDRPDLFFYKEPFLSLCPGFVWSALPNAKIMYIYRDGRDVANSLVETYDSLSDEKLRKKWGDEIYFARRYDDRHVPSWVEEGSGEAFIEAPQYVRAIWLWKCMIDRCLSFFDDLRTNSPSQFLSIRYETLVRHPQEVGDQILDFTNREGTYAFRRVLGNARSTSIGKHENRSRKEKREAEYIASSQLENLGYL